MKPSNDKELLLILQRYYFESESQQAERQKANLFSCCLSYKDTILKANHSETAGIFLACLAVAYPTKILFWKRITAIPSSIREKITLLLILQRYYFESESQRWVIKPCSKRCCCLSYKDTILKANHSVLAHLSRRFHAVAYPTKILFWKRITAISVTVGSNSKLLLILQRYYFESESQLKTWVLSSACCCCLSYKDTILKANHSNNRIMVIPS